MSSEVFEHKTRRMIYNHIEAHPGVSFLIIKKVFDLTDGTLRYHLKYLESENEIKSSMESNNKCFYPINNGLFRITVGSELKTHRLNHHQERIIDAIKLNPGITQKELIIKTNLKRIIVTYNLRKLLDFGVVQRVVKGRNSCYNFISDVELRKNIIKKLIARLLENELDEKTFIMLKKKLE